MRRRPMTRLVIPLFPGFMPLDAVGPYDVLRFLPDAEAVFAAQEPGLVRGSGGFGLHADVAIADLDSCDVLLVPGGGGTRDYEGLKPLIEWIARIHETTVWTTSVC